MIDTVIFDMDGTILDTLEDLKDAVNHVMKAHGYPEHSLDAIRSFVGNGVAVLMEKATPGGLNNRDFDILLSEFKEYYGAHSNDKTCAYDGILPLMDTLKKNGIKMAIVSNKPDFAVKDLNRMYFGEYIDVAIGDCADLKRKPAPDLVLKALKELSSVKDNSVYIGDSEVDYATACNSGLPCISVLWGFREEDYLRSVGATCFAKEPMGIIDIIANM